MRSVSAIVPTLREKLIDRQTRDLLRFAARYRRRYTLGIVCVVVTAAITLAAPWILRYAIDDLQLGVTSRKLLFYAGLTLAAALAAGSSRFLMRRIIIGASRDVEFDLRNAFFAHLQRLPLAFFHANRTGDLMSRATNDLSAVRMMVGPAVMYTASTALTFVVALTVMATINAHLTLIALIPLPVVTFVAKYFGRAIHHRFERIQAQLSDISAVTQEALAGVRVIRAYQQEGQEVARFREANQEYLDRNRTLIGLQGLFYPSMGLFMGLSELLVLWLGSRDVMNGRMSIGELVAFNAYLMMLSWPMIAFGWVTNLLQRGRASWGRMLAVMETPPAIADAPAARIDITAENIRGAIEFRHLTFRFGDRVVLDDLNVSIAAGDTVAIVGRTGAGKSTLLSLLARLHDPPPGTVFLDGHDVRELSLATLRGALGFVPQEPFLFSDTIAENVAFGEAGQTGRAGQAGGAGREEQAGGVARDVARDFSPARAVTTSATAANPNRHEIERVAAIARLDKDLPEFPHGYDTRVGERGITLSGGQKQRVAIARALYVDPRILILDDALSAVDTHTEDEILSGLHAFMRQRTSIIVSHRISTVRDADLILVLDAGRIVERGTHDELVARGGLYAQFHRQQLLEQELAAS